MTFGAKNKDNKLHSCQDKFHHFVKWMYTDKVN